MHRLVGMGGSIQMRCLLAALGMLASATVVLAEDSSVDPLIRERMVVRSGGHVETGVSGDQMVKLRRDARELGFKFRSERLYDWGHCASFERQVLHFFKWETRPIFGWETKPHEIFEVVAYCAGQWRPEDCTKQNDVIREVLAEVLSQRDKHPPVPAAAHPKPVPRRSLCLASVRLKLVGFIDQKTPRKIVVHEWSAGFPRDWLEP